MGVWRDAVLVDRSGGQYPLSDVRWRGNDLSPLRVSPIPVVTPKEIDLCTTISMAVSGGDSSRSWTFESRWARDVLRSFHSIGMAHQVQFKLEWFNPTGSFKDRGASVMLSHLASQGATRVLEDSSGNGGAAVAAYAAAANIAARIIVPEATSAAKILQSRAYGAEIELVGGTRDQVADEAIRQSATIPYASHNWHPMFLQGIKTIAYEMWESLGFMAPDNVVLVAGAGSLVLGCDIAFRELLVAGQIERLPRLLVGQPAQWATIADTFNGVKVEADQQRLPTIAEGASIARPVRLPEAVDAIRRSNGAAVGVTEDEIRSATRKLAARGLYAEPTSAVAAAALDRFLANGTIQPGESAVVVLTGSGLKSAERMTDVFVS